MSDLPSASVDLGPAITETLDDMEDTLESLGLTDDEACGVISEFLRKFVENMRTNPRVPDMVLGFVELLSDALEPEED